MLAKETGATITVRNVTAEHSLTGDALAEERALQFQGLRSQIGQFSSAQAIKVVASQGSNIREELQVTRQVGIHLDSDTSSYAVSVIQIEI